MSPHKESETLSVPIYTARPHVVRVLGCRVDALTSYEAIARIRALAERYLSSHVVTGNTLMLLAARTDAILAEIIERAAVVIPESWGVRWASQQTGDPLSEFIPGIDLMVQLCAGAQDDGHSVFFLGAAPGVAEEAASQLLARFPRLLIAGVHHGYFSPIETDSLISRIVRTQPRYIFVGMNVPEQEKWIARHLARLGGAVVMGVGGSFDVVSGRLRRAPVWMRRWGIEWVYRTLQQPWRFSRIKNLPVFMWHVWTTRRA